MQIITVTKSALFSEYFTLPMLTELATKYLGMSQEAVDKTAAQTLAKPSKTMANVAYAKLRTVLCTKLGNNPDYNDTFNAGQLQLEFDCLPDLDIGNAGKTNKRKTSSTGTRKTGSGVVPRTGAYKVTKRVASTMADPGKAELWQHVWNCATFEEFFAKCPPKGATKTGRIITASSEMGWAIKSGWIVPVTAEQQTEQTAA